jgi:hypothetical protein
MTRPLSAMSGALRFATLLLVGCTFNAGGLGADGSDSATTLDSTSNTSPNTTSTTDPSGTETDGGPVCGDGKVDTAQGEECDNGQFNDDSKFCTSSCKLATCGDGIKRGIAQGRHRGANPREPVF